MKVKVKELCSIGVKFKSQTRGWPNARVIKAISGNLKNGPALQVKFTVDKVPGGCT